MELGLYRAFAVPQTFHTIKLMYKKFVFKINPRREQKQHNKLHKLFEM